MSTFETKLQKLKDDCVSYDPDMDVSEGTINDVHLVISAGMWQGCETYIDNAMEVLPHNCNRTKLENYATIYSMQFTSETDTEDLRILVIEKWQGNSTNANKSGWEFFLSTLSKTISLLTRWMVRDGTKTDADGKGLARGVGTLDIVLPYGSDSILSQVNTACEAFTTCGSLDLQVIVAYGQTYDIFIKYYGDAIDEDAIRTEINLIFSNTKPSDKIYDSRIEQLFLQFGAVDATMYYGLYSHTVISGSGNSLEMVSGWTQGDIKPEKGILNLVSTYYEAIIGAIYIRRII